MNHNTLQSKQQQILYQLLNGLEKTGLISGCKEEDVLIFLRHVISGKPRHTVIEEMNITESKYNLLSSKSFKCIEMCLKKIFEDRQLKLFDLKSYGNVDFNKIEHKEYMTDNSSKIVITSSPIEYLNLPTRIHNSLLSIGIKSVQDVLNYSEQEYLEFYGFGEGMLIGLKDKLKSFGFQLMKG